MAEQDKPFRYLTQEEFLALPDAAGAEYLKRVTDHLSERIKALAARQKPEKS